MTTMSSQLKDLSGKNDKKSSLKHHLKKDRSSTKISIYSSSSPRQFNTRERSQVLLKISDNGPLSAIRIMESMDASFPEGKVIIQGWLVKQGGFRGGYKSWRRRWFVLKHDTICYYKACNDGDDASRDLGSQVLGIIPVRGARIVEVLESSKFWLSKAIYGNKNLFAIQTPSRTLWLKAETVDDKDVWISSLTKQIQSLVEPSGLRMLNGTGANSTSEIQEAKSGNEWELHVRDMVVQDKIAQGMFGEVFKGKLWGTPVAIKKLYIDESKVGEILQDLENEIEILSKLRHPNVVLYIGASTKFPDIRIVTEWCDRGSLSDLLYDSNCILNMELILKISIDIAQGMNYLHSIDSGIIHRDLKSENVLIEGNFNAKVADFGLSYKMASVKRSTGIYGTPRWMAPEIMLGKRYDHSVDVWSYGVVLCEMLSREKPYSDRYDIKNYDDVVEAVIDNQASPRIPEWCGKRLSNLIKQCLSRKPELRPSFAAILSELGAVYQQSSFTFLNIDICRILESLWSKSIKNRENACREISENIFRHRNNEAIECRRCGFSSDKSQDLSNLDSETLSLTVLRLSSALNEKNASLLFQALKAFRALFMAASPSQRSRYREIVQEEGCLRRLLMLLNSRNSKIQMEASKLLSAMTNDLTPEDQANFVDLTYSGLNALSALSGGYLGLVKLTEEINTEIQDLEERRSLLDDNIKQKMKLVSGLEESCRILHSKWQKEKIGVSDLRKSLRFSRAEVTLRGQNLGLSAVLGSSTIQENIDSVEDEIMRLVNTEEWADNSEISIIEEAPVSFMDYFGDSNRYLFDNALKWIEEGEKWETCFLFLFGDEIRVYEDVSSDADDPIAIVYIDDAMYKSLKVIRCFKMKGNVLVINMKDGRSFTFAYHSKISAFQWAHFIDPLSHEKPFSDPDAMESKLATGTGKELSALLLSYGSIKEKQEVLNAASVCEELKELPSHYAEYYDGLPVSMFGFILMNSSASIEQVWVSVFALLVNGELRIFSSIHDEPDDCQLVIYTSGPLKSENFVVITTSTPDEWSRRCFLLRDEGVVYKICAQSETIFLKWIAAFE